MKTLLLILFLIFSVEIYSQVYSHEYTQKDSINFIHELSIKNQSHYKIILYKNTQYIFKLDTMGTELFLFDNKELIFKSDGDFYFICKKTMFYRLYFKSDYENKLKIYTKSLN